MRSRLIIWLFGLVLLSVILIQTGKYSYEVDHSLSGLSSGGTAAFTTLLKETYPSIKVGEDIQNVEGTYIIPYAESFAEEVNRIIKEDKSKSTYILFEIPDFDKGDTRTIEVKNYQSEEDLGHLSGVRKYDPNRDVEWTPEALDETEQISVLVENDTETDIALLHYFSGKHVYKFTEAGGITNFHIGQANNAAIYLGYIQAANPSAKPMTLLGSYLDKSKRKGTIERLGPAFHSAWNQILVFVGVVFITLNIRFGKAPEPRPIQRSARELVDGVGDLARRKRMGRWALQSVFDQTLVELERRHRTSRQQILNRPEDFLTPEQATTLLEVQQSLATDIAAKEALIYSARLRALV